MKLWGGRFTKQLNAAADSFHSSLSFDRRLFEEDIDGGIAHAQMLGAQKIIEPAEAEKIAAGLKELKSEIQSGKIEIKNAEDIHSFIEAELIKKIGEAGKKLHTGRSRNDQIALDEKLFIKKIIPQIKSRIDTLINTLEALARKNSETIIPGYTHMQRAQPVTLAHHARAYIEMFRRDVSRLEDAGRRADECPLGAGALAATTYPLDREKVARELGFARVTQNSLDTVSDRDFIAELIFVNSLIMTHLSRFCEEIVYWSTSEFNFIELDDAFATGSSIMPQKKNPDFAELIRGKTGRVYGDLMGILTVIKGLPLSYNTDLQEDKEKLFDACDTVIACLEVFNEMIATVRFNAETMRRAASGGFSAATDAADYLVKKGAAFRDAHEIIGKLVLYCIDKNKSLEELSLDEYKKFSPVFSEDIFSAIDLDAIVRSRNIIGGPGRNE